MDFLIDLAFFQFYIRKSNYVGNLLYLYSQELKPSTMARPIKEPPELYGKDAERFEKLIAQPKPVSKEEIEKARPMRQ